MGKDQYSGVSRKQKTVIKNSGRCHIVHEAESYVIIIEKRYTPGKLVVKCTNILRKREKKGNLI